MGLIRPVINSCLTHHIISRPHVKVHNVKINNGTPITLTSVFLCHLLTIRMNVTKVGTTGLFTLRLIRRAMNSRNLNHIGVSKTRRNTFGRILGLFRVHTILVTRLNFRLFVSKAIMNNPKAIRNFSGNLFGLVTLMLFLFPKAFSSTYYRNKFLT